MDSGVQGTSSISPGVRGSALMAARSNASVSAMCQTVDKGLAIRSTTDAIRAAARRQNPWLRRKADPASHGDFWPVVRVSSVHIPPNRTALLFRAPGGRLGASITRWSAISSTCLTVRLNPAPQRIKASKCRSAMPLCFLARFDRTTVLMNVLGPVAPPDSRVFGKPGDRHGEPVVQRLRMFVLASAGRHLVSPIARGRSAAANGDVSGS